MGFDANEPEQRRRLQAVLDTANITTPALWLHYFSIGGSVGEYEVDAYLQGLISIPELERDLLAMAANELTDEEDTSQAPYADELPSDGIPEDPSPGEEDPASP